nr:MAG TPA: hypothetical protein [Caudoviricetes sp.]
MLQHSNPFYRQHQPGKATPGCLHISIMGEAPPQRKDD